MNERETAVPVWGPLRIGPFRSLWLSILACNVGSWMQTVGAQWLLVDEPRAATLVALVQTANMLPMLLFALPAGALADSFDHRRLLLGVTSAMAATGLALTALTAADLMPPALLLSLTFVMGTGLALTIPAWQTVIVDLVPRDHIAASAALGSISYNLARVVGPAFAGALLARTSTAAVFGVQTVSLMIFLVVVWRWRTTEPTVTRAREPFVAAIRAGGRYVRHAPVVRRVLLRVMIFAVPASALWALLPLVADQRLGMTAGGYGLLLAALGTGAVVGGFVLPWVSARLSGNQLLVIATLVYAAGVLLLVVVDRPIVIMIALLPVGTAWVAILAKLNAVLQLILPRWVRGRGMAINLVVNAGTQAVAAAGWGLLAQWAGLVTAIVTAGVFLLAGAVTVLWWPLRDPTTINLDQGAAWPPPLVEGGDIAPDAGPVLVTLTYRVPSHNEAAFVEAMQPVRRSRQRTGAIRWELARDVGSPGRFVEVYLVASWAEHLRQHDDRLTEGDQAYQRRALDLADGPPDVGHLLVASAD